MLSQHCANGLVRFSYKNHLVMVHKRSCFGLKYLLHAYIVETLSQTIIFLQCLMSKQCLNLFNHHTHITNYCFLLCVDFL